MWGGRQLYSLIGYGAAGAAIADSDGTIFTFTIPLRSRPIRSEVKMVVGANNPSTIKFTKTSAGDCGTLTLTAATATIGKVMYDITTYTADATPGAGVWLGSLNEGDRVTCIVSSSTDGTGTVIPMMILEADPEVPSNDSNMVAA